MKTIILRDQKNKDWAKQVIQETDITKPMVVEIKLLRNKRSLAQNNLLHMWMMEIADGTEASGITGGRYSPDTWKEYFKRHYLGTETIILPSISFDGVRVNRVKKTSKLNTKEFTEFLEKIERFAAAELNVLVSHPDHLYYEALGR